MYADRNKNGLIDGWFESWVDFNNNNVQDKNEKNIGDAALLKAMGANAVRIYHNNGDPKPKPTIHRLFKEFGIYTLLGNFFGMYAVDSGAPWSPGTDYTDPAQREKIKASVKAMVEEYKDEEGVLIWVLGNENNYDYGSQVRKNPDAYYKFVNETAEMIHEMDPTRPVAICNGDVQFNEIFARDCPAVDIFGCNSYQGAGGFGGLWYTVKSVMDRPALITEYGCDAYWEDKGPDDGKQLEYHKGNWTDIMNNRAGFGSGNALGGVAFQWMDEWWKSVQNDPSHFNEHATKGDWRGPLPDGWMHEEWLGIIGQGDGKNSPYMRQLRKTYFFYRKEWNKPAW
jgi:beta-glucuronidase